MSIPLIFLFLYDFETRFHDVYSKRYFLNFSRRSGNDGEPVYREILDRAEPVEFSETSPENKKRGATLGHVYSTNLLSAY